MSGNAYPINQFAPTYFGGLNTPPVADTEYEDKPYDYVYTPPGGQLTANQFLNPDSLAIQTDADFLCFGWYIAQFTGPFQIQLTDSTGYVLSNGLIPSFAISQFASDPTVFSPAHMFQAGGKILIAIQDLSAADNPLMLVFKGVKRMRRTPSAKGRK